MTIEGYECTNHSTNHRHNTDDAATDDLIPLKLGTGITGAELISNWNIQYLVLLAWFPALVHPLLASNFDLPRIILKMCRSISMIATASRVTNTAKGL
jgi:hypothetical protein